MIDLDIQPYLGALPLEFGMPRAEIHALLGTPWRSMPIWNRTGITDYWLQATLNAGFGVDGLLKHVGCAAGPFTLRLHGHVLWSPELHPDPNPALLRYDPAPVTALGFLVFPALGVTTTGFHDDDPAQEALTVFPRGAWDKHLAQATTPDLQRYRAT